jgi:hypothetical protein
MESNSRKDLDLWWTIAPIKEEEKRKRRERGKGKGRKRNIYLLY